MASLWSTRWGRTGARLRRTPTIASRPTAMMGSGGKAGSAWRWAWAGAGLGVVLALLLYAPAVWVERLVLAASDGRVRLDDSDGTVWTGSAQLVLTGGPGSRDAMRLPARVQWRMGLGWSGLNVALSADCCTTQPMLLHIAPKLQDGMGWRLRLEAHQSRWPAAVLAGLGTPWNTVQPQGALLLQTSGLHADVTLDRWSLQGQVQLEAQDLGSRLSTLRPLGSYLLTLDGGAQPRMTLTTRQGSLRLQGQGQWTAGHLRFSGEASAEEGHASELSNLLNILGRRDGARSIITIG